jgi:hypothetical protein
MPWLLRETAARIVRNLRRVIFACIVLGMPDTVPVGSFERLWRFVLAHSGIFRLRSLDPFNYHYQQPWQNCLYDACVGAVRWKHPGFRPVIQCDDAAPLLAAVERREKIVLVGLHSTVSTAFYHLLSDHDLAFSVIAWLGIDQETGIPSLQQTAGRLGFDRKLDIIPADENCLLLARKALAAGRIICCAPDRLEPPDETEDDRQQLVIEMGLFEFCRRMKVSLFYAVPSIVAEGAIDINLSGPHPCGPEIGTAAMAARFMAYADAVTGFTRYWRLAADAPQTTLSSGAIPAALPPASDRTASPRLGIRARPPPPSNGVG